MKRRKIQDRDWLYDFLRVTVVDRVTDIALGGLTVKGRENIPTDGAVIIGCNHTCALLDPLVILRAQGRRTVFMTRADIFKKRLLRKIFAFLKMLPIFRIRDGYSTLKHNGEIIDCCVDVLNDRTALALFPEATHRPMHSLLHLTKGIFHIALRADEVFGEDQPVYVVPMGIEYGHYFRFRPTAAVTYGKPINVTEFVRTLGKDLNEAQRLCVLREELTMRMQQLITYLPDDEDYTALWELTQLAIADKHIYHPGQRLQYNQITTHLLAALKREQPVMYEDLLREALHYRAERHRRHLNFGAMTHRHTVLAATLGTLLLLATLPYYLFCAMVTLPVWGVASILIRRAKDKVFTNTIRYGATLVYYLLLPLAAIGLLIGMPLIHAVTGILALWLALPFFYDYNAYLKVNIATWRYAGDKEMRRRTREILQKLRGQA